jgi:hypothetical protein
VHCGVDGSQSACEQLFGHEAPPQVGAVAPQAPSSQQRIVPAPEATTPLQAPSPAHLTSHVFPRHVIGPHPAPAAQLIVQLDPGAQSIVPQAFGSVQVTMHVVPAGQFTTQL